MVVEFWGLVGVGVEGYEVFMLMLYVSLNIVDLVFFTDFFIVIFRMLPVGFVLLFILISICFYSNFNFQMECF
jgi:hypothetical protein